jgi:hypothetical protein
MHDGGSEGVEKSRMGGSRSRHAGEEADLIHGHAGQAEEEEITPVRAPPGLAGPAQGGGRGGHQNRCSTQAQSGELEGMAMSTCPASAVADAAREGASPFISGL